MVRFSYRMVPEVYQVFWAGMAAGEFINDAAIAAGSYRKQGARWLAAVGGVRPRRGRNLKGRCLTLAQREEIALGRARGDSIRAIAAIIGRSPSTGRVCPVIQAASLEARKATAAATSSGSPTRPSGYQWRKRSAPPSWPSQFRVLMVAGATVFTRMPSAARLAARLIVRAPIPAFADEYGSLPKAARALTELTLTIAGLLALRRR